MTMRIPEADKAKLAAARLALRDLSEMDRLALEEDMLAAIPLTANVRLIPKK